MNDFWTHAMFNINFAIGALAFGMWMVLAFFWMTKTTGTLRITLVWVAANIMCSLGLRAYQLLNNYDTNNFGCLDWFRLGFNLSTLGLGVYLARHSDRINRREELNGYES